MVVSTMPQLMGAGQIGDLGVNAHQIVVLD